MSMAQSARAGGTAAAADAASCDKDTLVFARVRPVLARDEAGVVGCCVFPKKQADSARAPGTCVVCAPAQDITGRPITQEREFNVDVCFGANSTNEQLYAAACSPLVRLVASGGTGVLYAYGQTGSGKTYTVSGMLADAGRELFSLRHAAGTTGPVFLTAIEMLGKGATDLLSWLAQPAAAEAGAGGSGVSPDGSGAGAVRVLEDRFGSVQLSGASEAPVSSPEEFLATLSTAMSYRRTRSTFRNDGSSRSHFLVRCRAPPSVQHTIAPPPTAESAAVPSDSIICPYDKGPATTARPNPVRQRQRLDGRQPTQHVGASEDGFLWLVDLAGSESARDQSQHDASLVAESKLINTSLMTLKDCIHARSMQGRNPRYLHIPYRNTPLTHVLRDAFELAVQRPVRTSVIACVSPLAADCGQTIGTLRYASELFTAAPQQVLRADPEDPSNWSKEQCQQWVSLELAGKVTLADLLPDGAAGHDRPDTGKALCTLPQNTFVSRCVAHGIGEKRATAVYLRLWERVTDARTRQRQQVLKARGGHKRCEDKWAEEMLERIEQEKRARQ